MESRIINIKNSEAVIIPQSFLDECSIRDIINIDIKKNHIIISAPGEEKRKGWDKAFKEMAANGDDRLIISDVFDDEHFGDWKW